jgi:hypothetical protein
MKKHLFLQNNSTSENFTGKGGGGLRLPERDRNHHSNNLLNQISAIERNVINTQYLEPFQNGYYVEFSSEPNFPLNLISIESDGRKLVSVKTVDNTETATVFLDENGLSRFEAKVERYQREVNPRSNLPKNKSLVESISEVKLASIHSLWTDTVPFPDENELIRWEVWLRAGENELERERILEFFRNTAEAVRIETSSREIRFPETTVVLVQATARQISQSFYPLNILSELRKAIDPADFFLGLARDEEQLWVNDAVRRIQPPAENAPAVCLLDTGVTHEHPLLNQAITINEMDAYIRAEWGIDDHHGHGTGMAGLSLHGDLVEMLASNELIQLKHRIESVKILPQEGENPLEQWGEITKHCIALAEIFAPNRNRVICLAVTSTDHRFRGAASSWSGLIDELASVCNEENKMPRLFFISAGNIINQADCVDYPNNNLTDEIDNPAQSFNAITVGAYTDKVIIEEPMLANQLPLAPRGGLSPHSKTSVIWKDEWANKPDIVLEGGNLVYNPNEPIQTPSLQLLTTNSDWQRSYLTDFYATSAATALASRLGVLILAEYPKLRAETVRALVIHSASWTEQMLQEFPTNNQQNKRSLLRCYGYGVPNLEKALYSANNSVTLITEDSLRPFIKEPQKSEASLNEMNLHEIPWAADVLIGLVESDVEMRVTLSYFIEPNPSGKGYKNKHRYTSHQLRFEVIRRDEEIVEFRRRVNRAAREENEEFTSTGSDNGWAIGTKLRHKGSVHSDIWRGTAADLATKNVIAVYPVGGWWKDLKRQEKWNSIANYSLIVSIKTQETEIDLYTPIQNQIMIPIEV